MLKQTHEKTILLLLFTNQLIYIPLREIQLVNQEGVTPKLIMMTSCYWNTVTVALDSVDSQVMTVSQGFLYSYKATMLGAAPETMTHYRTRELWLQKHAVSLNIKWRFKWWVERQNLLPLLVLVDTD